MSQPTEIPGATAVKSKWDRQTVFKTFADPVRWGLFSAIIRNGPSTASQLKVAVNRQLDATTKQLAYLEKLGFLTVKPDPKDGRRALYSIAPDVPVSKTPTETTVDFGHTLLRL